MQEPVAQSTAANRVIKNSQTFPGELTHARNPPCALGGLPPPPHRCAAVAAVMPHEVNATPPGHATGRMTVREHSLARLNGAMLTTGDGRRGAPTGAKITSPLISLNLPDHPVSKLGNLGPAGG